MSKCQLHTNADCGLAVRYVGLEVELHFSSVNVNVNVNMRFIVPPLLKEHGCIT